MRTNTIRAKKVLIALFAMLSPLLVNAYDFEKDGIYYNITSLQDLTVEVTFSDNKYIGDIIIPASVEYSNRIFIVTKLGDSAFSNSQITSVSIPNTVTEAGTYVFKGCHNLSSISIPPSMTIFGNGCFKSCYNLSHVVIEDSNTTLSLPYNEWQTENSSYFANCNLKTVYLGRNVSFRTSEDYDGLFWDQSDLEEVTIGDSVTEIGIQEFIKCTGLKRIEIPTNVKRINFNAFYGCTGLKNLILNEGLQTISNGAFRDCHSIKSLIIPSSVTSIGDNAFGGCTGIKKVYSKITTPKSIQETTFAGYIYLNATLYVPTGSKSLYEEAAGWKNFSTIIEIDSFNNIKDFISEITLCKTSITLTENDTITLSATVTPDEAEDKTIT